MNNVLVVSNPNAGRKKAIKHRKRIQKLLLKISNRFKFITIDDLSIEQVSDFDTIIAMGGDGTIHKILPFIVNSDKKLSILPFGTANLLAGKLGIPTNINKAIKKLETGNIKEADVIQINEDLSVLRFGIGYDSNIICKTPQSMKNKFGYFAYFIAGIIFALRLKKRSFELVIDNETRKIDASCIIIANASNMYKTLFSVGKNTKINDGKFDVFILKTENPILFFIELLKIAFKNYQNTNSAEFFQTDKLLIKNKWINSHIDGEKKNITGDIEFKILHNALKIYS